MASLFMLGTLFACSCWLNFHFMSGKHAMGQNPIGWVELPFAARPSLVALPLESCEACPRGFWSSAEGHKRPASAWAWLGKRARPLADHETPWFLGLINGPALDKHPNLDASISL